ncbi:MAG: bifunctional phosphoglucose/phosphomannose isomerase [Acidobacteria bacterium]|nr:bifunctional phosphoglucose/phosphomannose isomerase [Acidobacteriota bacterium]
MSVLDQPDQWMSIDPKGMHALLGELPEQVKETVQAGRNLSIPFPGTVHSIVVTGLGGSAIGGDLARSIAGRDLKKPFIVNRDYELPAFVDASTLLFACSYSGNTEETLSAYRQAVKANASILCITSGGKLQAQANADGHPVLILPEGLPPRAALGHSLFMLLSAMQALGVIPDMTESIDETIGLLFKLRDRYGPMNPVSSNPAKTIANSLSGKIIAVYGSSAVLDATAFRWRSQIEENAKNLAFHHVLPEMNHNELVGWLYPAEALQRIGVVLLRDKGDHPQVQRRFELTKDIISGRAGALHEVWSEGESLLARVMSLIYLGDFVSLYISYLNNADPTPVEVIDYLKRKLNTMKGGG